jgi:hypothetical protein
MAIIIMFDDYDDYTGTILLERRALIITSNVRFEIMQITFFKMENRLPMAFYTAFLAVEIIIALSLYKVFLFIRICNEMIF